MMATYEKIPEFGQKEQSEEITDVYRNLVSIVYKVIEAFRDREIICPTLQS